MNRKLRKLLNHPRLFMRDMVRQRLPNPVWRLTRAPRRYSVVTAVYGVERYLDEFFGSLVGQSLDFERFIEVILVDDGSPDGSAEVIARWQAKYPACIRYLRKDNGGQASARNLGLEYATGDWVTFIDPDDFVDARYFEHVDALISGAAEDRLLLVACKIIFHRTSGDSDTHPLRSLFTWQNVVLPVDADYARVQLSASSAFFRGDLLRTSGQRFDEEIRPCFEDGHFVGRYLLRHPGGDVGFCGRARYYYRKRDDGSSTLDRSWSDPARFDVVFTRGYLDLMRAAAEASGTGQPALWVQRTVLYELVWYLETLLDKAHAFAFLSEAQRQRFKGLVGELLRSVDAATIMEFDLAGAGDYHKVGLLGHFKGLQPERTRVYVRDYDPTRQLAMLGYWYWGPLPREVFRAGGSQCLPTFAKVCRHDLLGEDFVHERVVWLPIEQADGMLQVSLNGSEAQLFCQGHVCRDGLEVAAVAALRGPPELDHLPLRLRLEYALATSPALRATYRDALVFMDRDTRADDNAEHLYRYAARHRPDLNAFFVLRQDSQDWQRLEAEGFRLLPFGSRAHRRALINAKHLISSQADRYVVDYPSERGWDQLRQRRFTFLQHGVTHHDLSRWLNGKRIDCLITASPEEYAAMSADGGRYEFTERELVLTGFPRHDRLLAGERRAEHLLVIMPTWRESLMGRPKGLGNERELNPAFFESEFAKTWKQLLHSPRLRQIVEAHGYRVQFFPHTNLLPYLEWFAAPAHISTVDPGAGGSIQDLLRAAALMVTDYSSVAFEMAYLKKPVVYYQFDRPLVYGGGHSIGEGYFDFERDGFGPVALDEGALLDAIVELLSRGATPAAEHLARMDRAFAFRDGRCCERTLGAILALDEPRHRPDSPVRTHAPTSAPARPR